MKTISILGLGLMLVMTVACGGKDKGSSNSGTFSSALTTQNGYYNIQTMAIEVGGQIYPPSQQYAVVMNQALDNARRMNIQPVNVGGVMKYRARITAQSMNYNNTGYNTGYNSGGYNTGYNSGYTTGYNNQYGSSQLNITNVQFY